MDDSEETEDTIREDLDSDTNRELPCERPNLEIWDQGVAVFGAENNSAGKSRSSSTSINRVEFINLSSTLPSLPSTEELSDSMALWDEGAYTAYKLNCHKKKRKVENLIQLYDKDSVNTLQDRDIYQQKLSEISSAALEAAVYIEDLIDQLEVNGEEARITELNDIKKHIFSIVKKNEKEVKEEMQSIVDRAEAASAEASQGVTPTTTPPQPLTAADLQNAIAGLVIPAHSDTNGAVHGATSSEHKVAKLRLKRDHLNEDTSDLINILKNVKSPNEMSDSEVILNMKLVKVWDKKADDIVSELRKIQVEALGVAEVQEDIHTLEGSISSMKNVKKEKVEALSLEDRTRGLNSLCENKNRGTVVYPDPFYGRFGENVFKFRDEIKTAIRDSQVKCADQVKTLVKYLRGDAKLRVGDHQPDLETALTTLVGFYGNSNLIWLKCKQDFELAFKGDPNRNWGELGTTKRVDTIAKVLEFIRQSQQYAVEYPELKEEILSSHTVSLLTKIMPMDYIERVYLTLDSTTASPTSKIEKMKEILEKLKTCAVLAVNQLGTASKSDKPKQNSDAVRNPLGLAMSHSTICSVSASHECHRSSKCQPSWGLLGCIELYKLKSVHERAAYCKESSCCFVCGSGDLSDAEKSEFKHKRCNFRSPTDRFLTKCTAWRSKNSQGRKLYCFYGAALCPDHQNISNTSPELIEWLKEKKIRHDMFSLGNQISNQVAKAKTKSNKCAHKNESVSDKDALDMLKSAMKDSEFEGGKIQDLPQGENMFMFFLLQGKPGTDPIQVFCDSGANFWFAVESVTKKLVCVQTYKGSLPINVAGGKVVYSTGEWVAAIPLDNGTYQAVRGLTMKSVVGQMPRFDLRRTLEQVKSQYKENSTLQ